MSKVAPKMWKLILILTLCYIEAGESALGCYSYIRLPKKIYTNMDHAPKVWCPTRMDACLYFEYKIFQQHYNLTTNETAGKELKAQGRSGSCHVKSVSCGDIHKGLIDNIEVKTQNLLLLVKNNLEQANATHLRTIPIPVLEINNCKICDTKLCNFVFKNKFNRYLILITVFLSFIGISKF